MVLNLFNVYFILNLSVHLTKAFYFSYSIDCLLPCNFSYNWVGNSLMNWSLSTVIDRIHKLSTMNWLISVRSVISPSSGLKENWQNIDFNFHKLKRCCIEILSYYCIFSGLLILCFSSFKISSIKTSQWWYIQLFFNPEYL